MLHCIHAHVSNGNVLIIIYNSLTINLHLRPLPNIDLRGFRRSEKDNEILRREHKLSLSEGLQHSNNKQVLRGENASCLCLMGYNMATTTKSFEERTQVVSV